MALFKAYEPNVEVNSETILSFVNGLGVFKDSALKMLREHGIQDLTPGQWYLQQAWLDAFKDLNDIYGKNCIIMVARAIPQSANFPDDINTIEKALASIDVAYHMNHRNGRIGSYTFTQSGPRQGIMMCNNPYHCDFDQALIRAMADKFKNPSNMINIKHNESGCRLNGANSCTYMISW